MSTDHKEALAVGRKQGKAVKDYLEALEANKPKRGRKRTADSVQKQLVAVESKIATADPLTRLQLVQERINLRQELEMRSAAVDLSQLEDAFVGVAADYGRRKGISYAAWREAGVDAEVLERAGISRGST